MPISEKKESGDSSTRSQPSDYVAVVPIKKRRFPIVWPLSPPPQSLPTLPEEIHNQQDANSVSDVSNSSNFTEVASHPSSLVESEKSIGPPEMQITVIKRSKPKHLDETHRKLESVREDETGCSTVSGGSLNTVSWKQRAEASHNKDNLCHFSLNLSLTDGQCSVLTNSGMKSDTEDSLLRANKLNWDLNLIMDNWDASISDAASVSTDSVYGALPSHIKFDVKHPVASIDFMRDSISGKMISKDFQLKVVDSCLTDASSLKAGLPMPLLDSKKIQVSQCPTVSVDPIPKVARVLSSSGNSSVGVPVIVKGEPFVEPSNQKLTEVQPKELITLSVNRKMVKLELVEKSGLGIAGKSSHVSPNVGDPTLVVKSEPGLMLSHLPMSTSEETTPIFIEQSRKGTKSCMRGTKVVQMSKALESEPTRSNDRYVGGSVDTQVSENKVMSMSQDAMQISSNSESPSFRRRIIEEQIVSCGENTVRVQERNLGTVGNNKPEPIDELPSSREDDDDCVSEGKIDTPTGMDQDSYDSECETDGNVATSKRHREDNEYEDGELREQSINMGPNGPTCAMQKESVANGENELAKSGSQTCPSVVSPPKGYQDSDMQFPVDMDVEQVNRCSDIVPDEKITKTVTEDSQLQKTLAVDKLGELHMDNATASQREVDPSATNTPLEDQEVEYIPGEAVDNNISMVNFAPAIYSNIEYTNHSICDDNDGEECSTLPEIEACLNNEIVGKDGSDDNRVLQAINLSRAYNMSSPGKTRSADRSLTLQFGRKRLPDVVLEGEKPHLQGRDGVNCDDFNHFSRERNQDMFSRNPRSSYTHDRGRGHNNMCSADWEPDQDFVLGGICNRSVEYRPARYNKYKSDYRNYEYRPNNRFSGGAGYRGRKFFNEGLNFHDRRYLHNGRDGMVEVPRKFRDLPDDMKMFPCSRPPPYEESDGGFSIQGERNFNKGLHRIHSKSQIRLRNRSPPVQWSSRRRRSPDGFVEPSHRRSPAIYREGERVRSPPPGVVACFHGDSMIRRQQGCPPYMSQQMDDVREMNYGRDHHHGFGRGRMHHSRGGSSGRGSHRTRRCDMENSRERTRGGDYFRLSMHSSGRFHDFYEGGGSTDERRRLGDKWPSVRHFQPCYGDEEKFFRNNMDESSRSSYRMCHEDVVYQERSSSRERQQQLERHMKNEAVKDATDTHNSSNKRRKVEEDQEQEGNFRQSDGERNDEFEDMQQSGERKRF